MRYPIDVGINRAHVPDKALPWDERQRFIRRQLGLTHDPFLHYVAEQELEYEADQFFVYYVDAGSDRTVNVLDVLKQPNHGVVLAPAGGGKTTLRFNLVRRLHRSAPHILPVVCELSELRSFSLKRARELINRELAKDLLIALLDRFEPLASTTLEPESPLACILGDLLHNSTYHRVLERIVQMADSQASVPLNSFWEDLGRAGLPPVSWVSPELGHFSRALLKLQKRLPAQVVEANMAEAVNSLGFTHVFLLVDGIDASERSVHQMAHMLELLVEAALAYPVPFLFKLFAPLELSSALHSVQAALTASAPVDGIELQWTEPRLSEALLQRLRAAGSGLDNDIALFDYQDAQQIQAEIAQAAGGSPRRLYQLISHVIDAHIRRGNAQPALTHEDWQAAKQAAALS